MGKTKRQRLDESVSASNFALGKPKVHGLRLRGRRGVEPVCGVPAQEAAKPAGHDAQQDPGQFVGGIVDIQTEPGEGDQERQNQRRNPEPVMAGKHGPHGGKGRAGMPGREGEIFGAGGGFQVFRSRSRPGSAQRYRHRARAARAVHSRQNRGQIWPRKLPGWPR